MASTSSPTHLRSLYRAILRELPPRPLRSSATRSPIHDRVRSSFATGTTEESAAVAKQLVAYLRSQRTYATLLERYNPGMDMSEKERVRLTARRVGMDLPNLHADKE